VLASARAEDGTWQFKLTPYAWTIGLDGDVGAGGLTAPVDAKFLDAVENLDLAGMLSAEANNGTWGLLFDGAYLKLSDDSNTAIGKVDVESEQWILQGAAVYRVVKNEKTTVDFGAGARSMDMDMDISTDLRDASGTKNWVDPILVARVRQQFAEKWFGTLSGDIGGFGVSSELTWQLVAAAGYSVTENVSVLLGYRHLDYDYDKDGFIYDAASRGLALGLQFDL
jgi:hypothetical protein